MKPLSLLAPLAAALALALTACGEGDGEGAAGASDGPRLTVSAAASLKNAFEGYADSFDQATVRLSFAGSDELAAQVRQGAKPGVYAAANTTLPEQLFREGLVERPVLFAANRLVVAVPTDSDAIDSVDDLGRPGVELVVGSPSVPIGSYTREVLGRLGEAESKRILDNVRSNEPDVSGIIGKLTQRAADAGLVYITDVAATKGKLRAIELPAGLQPSVAYAAAVVKGTDRREEAKAFVQGLLNGKGRTALRRAGFEPPPK